MDAQCLVYAGVEVWEKFDLIASGDHVVPRSEMLVKLPLQSRLHLGVGCEIIDDGTCGAGENLEALQAISTKLTSTWYRTQQ